MEYLRDNQIFIDENTLSVNITRLRTKLKEMGLNMYTFIIFPFSYFGNDSNNDSYGAITERNKSLQRYVCVAS